MSAINLLVVSVIGVVFLSAQVVGDDVCVKDPEPIGYMNKIIATENSIPFVPKRNVLYVEKITVQKNNPGQGLFYTFNYCAFNQGSTTKLTCIMHITVVPGKNPSSYDDNCQQSTGQECTCS